jgi:hypothetical protein
MAMRASPSVRNTGRTRLMAAAAAVALAAPGLAGVSEPRERFDGQSVVGVRVASQRDLLTLMAVSDDLWVCGEVRAGEVPARVDAAGIAALEGAGLRVRVLVPDVQALIDAESARLARVGAYVGDGKGGARGEDFFADFRRYEDMVVKLGELALARPDVCATVTLGPSVQGRDIPGIVIHGTGRAPGERPAIVINATQHAREWIAGSSAMYVADRLVTLQGSDERITALLDAFDVHVIPLVNPDGYVHTWDVSRLWRKNRRPAPEGSSCRGVDLNRNWSVGWGLDSGSSPNPCSDTYRGTGAFSEPETAAVRDYMLSVTRLAAHIDTHTYGRLVLSPWGYTVDLPPDAASFDVVNGVLESALEAVNDVDYTAGPGSQVLYLSSGAARDYSYGDRDAFGWTIEMSTRFVDPPEQIVPNGEELLAATLALGEWLGANLVVARVPADAPATLTADEPATIGVEMLKGLTRPNPTSVVVYWRLGTLDPFTPVPASAAGSGRFEAVIPAPACNAQVQWYATATTLEGDQVVFPAPGAAGPVVVWAGGESCPAACPADWDRNGTPNSTDVSAFINDWFIDLLEGGLGTDVDHNGVVNSTDVSEFINAWFGC